MQLLERESAFADLDTALAGARDGRGRLRARPRLAGGGRGLGASSCRVKTVNKHVAGVLDKLGVGNRHEAVRAAARLE